MQNKNKKEKRNKVEEQNKSEFNINWYPGHMYKTKNEIKEIISSVDIVLEIRDARIPKSSSNRDIKEIISNKSHIILLNKKDLADESETRKWIKYLEEENVSVLDIDASSKKDLKLIKEKIFSNNKIKEKNIKAKEKGINNPSINILILGIPNVGKSTLINNFVGKKSQEVKNVPGVTKKNKWIRTDENINILDTPGILWPKLIGETGLMLSAVGSVKMDLIPRVETANFLIKKIIENGYYNNLIERYGLNFPNDLEDFLRINKNIDIVKNNIRILSKDKKNNEEKIEEYKYKLEDYKFIYNTKIYELFIKIGKKRGFLQKGNNIDEEKTAVMLINEFQKGILGKITLEKV